MAVRTLLTNQGLALLGSSSEVTGQYYWIGYYALAYVPDVWKVNPVDLPDELCGAVNSGVPIESTDTDIPDPSMTRLTKYGDMIWNVWQGDLVGTGYFNASDGSSGGDLFGLINYNSNVRTHYRYVIDENGNNTLVAWIDDPDETTGKLLGKYTYHGTDGFVQSELPIPAPLYYIGDTSGNISTASFFPDFENEDGPYGNGGAIYPYIEVDVSSVNTIKVPRVSADYRGYLDSQGSSGSSYDYPVTASVPFFDSRGIPYQVDAGFDETSWFYADQSWRVKDPGSSVGDPDSTICKEFWKLYSISNYNRYHAPVNQVGFILDSELSSRNMAKATKFFPISNYKVINTSTGLGGNGQVREIATAIQIVIDLDINPRTLGPGVDNGVYDENGNLSFFDNYVNGTKNKTGDLDQFGGYLYESTHNSFKFNRIGLYAVKLRKAPYAVKLRKASYVQDQGFTYPLDGANLDLQFQLDPDSEPVLFAVMDWDNTVVLDDTGNGAGSFYAEVNVNLESPDDSVDTPLIRDSSIFYNLYEDDSLRWYQNQLVANASTQNAITELGLEISALTQKINSVTCCPPPNISALIGNNSQTSGGGKLRNLLDADQSTDGGLKGVDTLGEGQALTTTYNSVIASDFTTPGEDTPNEPDVSVVNVVGGDSIVLGYSTVAEMPNSFVNGYSNLVYRNPTTAEGGGSAFIGNGYGNMVYDDARYCSILNGKSNWIEGKSSTDSTNASYYGVIISGYKNRILAPSNASNKSNFIGNGAGNELDATDYGTIINGYGNRINAGSRSAIITGTTNLILSAVESIICAGRNNKLNPTNYYAFIGAGTGNEIASSYSAIVGAGSSNKITASSYAGIVVGSNNTLTSSTRSIIGAGYYNTITSSTYASILNGDYNTIESVNYGLIASGNQNSIKPIGTGPSFTGGGIFNGILNIISSSLSTTYKSNWSVIMGGDQNSIRDSAGAFIGAGTTNIIHGDDVPDGGIPSQFSWEPYSSHNSVIVGGDHNWISTSHISGIAGGARNSVVTSYNAFIGGGAQNYIWVNTSSNIAGGVANFIKGSLDTYVWADTGNTIGGGYYNAIPAGIRYGTIPGGYGAEANIWGAMAYSTSPFTKYLVNEHPASLANQPEYGSSQHVVFTVRSANDITGTVVDPQGSGGNYIWLTLDGSARMPELPPLTTFTGTFTVTNQNTNPTGSCGESAYDYTCWSSIIGFIFASDRNGDVTGTYMLSDGTTPNILSEMILPLTASAFTNQTACVSYLDDKMYFGIKDPVYGVGVMRASGVVQGVMVRNAYYTMS